MSTNIINPSELGELLVYLPVNEEYDETKLIHGLWSRRMLIIRSGCLEIANEPNNYRIPLRQLHLVASPSRKYAIVLKQFDSSISIVIQVSRHYRKLYLRLTEDNLGILQYTEDDIEEEEGHLSSYLNKIENRI